MRRKVLQAVGALWLAALALLASSAAVAQQATTLVLSSRSVQIEDLLRQGRQLELQRRWGEALTHYEDGLRLFPAEQSIERRFESARLHYDLGRRYADRSFCQSLAAVVRGEGVGLVCRRAVEDPDPLRRGTQLARACCRHGGNDFEVALGEPVFRRAEHSGARLAGRRSASAWKRGGRSPRGPWRAARTPATPWRPSPRWPSNAWKSARRRRSWNTSAGRPTAWIPTRPTSPPTNSARSIRRSRATSSAWGSS